jgi:hypothetical protein
MKHDTHVAIIHANRGRINYSFFPPSSSSSSSSPIFSLLFIFNLQSQTVSLPLTEKKNPSYSSSFKRSVSMREVVGKNEIMVSATSLLPSLFNCLSSLCLLMCLILYFRGDIEETRIEVSGDVQRPLRRFESMVKDSLYDQQTVRPDEVALYGQHLVP